MRRSHFEALGPVCPVCRQNGLDVPLQLGPDVLEDASGITAGVLRCTSETCGRRYPIVDGAPILVPDLAGWFATSGHLVLQRCELPGEVEELVGQALGPDAAFNVVRQQQASYAYDHYGDLAPDLPQTTGTVVDFVTPGAVRRCLSAALERMAEPSGPMLDLGCAAGRTSFDLAAAGDGLVLGVDVNWPLLSIGRGIIDRGVLSYPHRRVGVTFERRRQMVSLAGAERVDFWVADAQALPFRSGTFGFASALNVLDCVSEPPRLLAEMVRVLTEGSGVALATPFDWASHATPPAAWINGPDALEDILAAVDGYCRQAGYGAFVTTGSPEEVLWQVRLHDRAAMRYLTHLVTGVVR